MFLGLDLGTTNVKAVLVSRDGRVHGRASAPVQLCHIGQDGIEQDIEDIWQAAVSAIRRAGARSDLAGVRAVGISSQGGALQVLDAGRRPIGPVISWLDRRGRTYDEALTAELGARWFSRHVGHETSTVAAGQILRLREQQPRLVRSPNRVGFVGDVVVSRLCGRQAHDATSLSIAGLLNPTTAQADGHLLERLGILPEQLPEILRAGQRAGELQPEAARATGLPQGIPVSCAVHDQYAGALGIGAVHAGDIMFGAGTAWVLLASVRSEGRAPLPVVPSAYVSTHVVDGLYGQLLSMGNGGSAVSWAADLLGLPSPSVGDIDRLVRSSPPGSRGLRFCPLLAGGAAEVPPDASGRLTGLRLSHGRSDIMRSVLEGLALELARYVGILANAGIGPERLVMCGGAASSSVAPGLVADATGVPVACARESDTSALGAAIIARALVEQAGLAELSDKMRSARREIEPGMNRPLYRRLAEEYREALSRANSGGGN